MKDIIAVMQGIYRDITGHEPLPYDPEPFLTGGAENGLRRAALHQQALNNKLGSLVKHTRTLY